jgi:hypothetical protein
LKDAAHRSVRRCNVLRREAPSGDKPVRAFVRALVFRSGNQASDRTLFGPARSSGSVGLRGRQQAVAKCKKAAEGPRLPSDAWEALTPRVPRRLDGRGSRILGRALSGCSARPLARRRSYTRGPPVQSARPVELDRDWRSRLACWRIRGALPTANLGEMKPAAGGRIRQAKGDI